MPNTASFRTNYRNTRTPQLRASNGSRDICVGKERSA
jgi:hypothetical protein